MVAAVGSGLVWFLVMFFNPGGKVRIEPAGFHFGESYGYTCLRSISIEKQKFSVSIEHWGASGGLIRFLISAQVMFSQFVGSDPVSGSVVTVWSLTA